jgi:hypothetical protein
MPGYPFLLINVIGNVDIPLQHFWVMAGKSARCWPLSWWSTIGLRLAKRLAPIMPGYNCGIERQRN